MNQNKQNRSKRLALHLIFVLLCTCNALVAQDVHFSQFYASPLTLNPALTGNFNGFYRISAIYRNQWPGLTQGRPSFSTPSVSLDFSLLHDKIKHGALGVGIVFLNDQQNGKTINQNTILGSVAYNMGFGPKGKFQLGLGLQGGISMIKMDFSNYEFGASYNADLVYDPNLNPEAYSTGTKIKGVLNAGIFLKSEFYTGMRVYAGYSFNNATNYKQDFLISNAHSYRLPFRHTIHGGFEFDISDRGVIIPGALFQMESKSYEVNFGLTGGIHIIRNPAKRATLFVGLWNRLNTGNYTLIPNVGFEVNGIKAAFSYDIHLNQQYNDYKNIGGSIPQGFEVSLSYIGKLMVSKPDNDFLYNPRY